MPSVWINPLKDRRWENLIDRHHQSTYFHQTSWARVLHRTYGYTPYYLVTATMNDTLTSGCPFFLVSNLIQRRRLICLPYTDYCGPLISSERDRTSLSDNFLSMNHKAGISYIEIRGGTGFPRMIKQTYYKRFTIDLSPGVSEVWRRLSDKSIRYSIRKAEREQIVIKRGESEPELNQFYQMNVMTRRLHGVIPQPHKFFRLLFNEFIENQTGFLLLAQKDRKITAGSVFLLYKDVIYHKYNASVPWSKYLCSNHLILWHAIKWAIKHGLKTMDLGRTAPDNTGLISYKRHWGSAETDLPYYYYPNLHGINAGQEGNLKYRGIRKIIKHTPPMILKKIGDSCYRYIA